MKNELPEHVKGEIVAAGRMVDAERTEVKGRLKMLNEAAAEQTFSGQLRRAIHASGFDLDLLSRRAEIEIVQLDEFLTGERTLRSDAIDRLAMSLGIQLTIAPPLPISNSVTQGQPT